MNYNVVCILNYLIIDDIEFVYIMLESISVGTDIIMKSTRERTLNLISVHFSIYFRRGFKNALNCNKA
jgi:hypothetical protein